MGLTRRMRKQIWRRIGDLFMEHPVVVPLVLVLLFVVKNWIFPELQEIYYDLPAKNRFLYESAAGIIGFITLFLILQFV